METITLGKVIFIGTEIEAYDILKSIIGKDLLWGKNLIHEEELINYDILFFEKKSFYKYHKLLENTVQKKNRSIYLINDNSNITKEEIQRFRNCSVRDAFHLPTQKKQLEKTLQLLKRINQKKK